MAKLSVGSEAQAEGSKANPANSLLSQRTEQRQIELDQGPSRVPQGAWGGLQKKLEGFDSGSERTLAAWIRHASRGNPSNGGTGVRGSKAWVPTLGFGIAIRDGG